MPEWVLQVVAMVLGVIGAGVGVYAAIRADLAELRVKAEAAGHAAQRANDRIDDFFQQRGARDGSR